MSKGNATKIGLIYGMAAYANYMPEMSPNVHSQKEKAGSPGVAKRRVKRKA